MTEQPKFGLRENFISELEKRLVGKIVSVRGQGMDFSIIGKLKHYVQGEIAVLSPYVLCPFPNKRGFEIKKEESIISSPGLVSTLGYKNIDELVKKYIKPMLEKQKQERKEKK